jgi:putative DNA primase/helicase
VPQFKIFLAANYKPSIEGQDLAMWRRVRLIPFLVTIPPADQDPQLINKLKAEAPGILRWALSGCVEWQQEGLKVPDSVKRATKEYRTESDILADFLNSQCIINPPAQTPFSNLYRAYECYCAENGEAPISKKEFSRRLTTRGLVTKPGSKNKKVTKGIGLLYEPIL